MLQPHGGMDPIDPPRVEPQPYEGDTMFGRARTAVKFLVYGLIIGLMFAPRSGEESRKEAINWVRGLIGGNR